MNFWKIQTSAQFCISLDIIVPINIKDTYQGTQSCLNVGLIKKFRKMAGKWLRHLPCDQWPLTLPNYILNHFSTIFHKVLDGAHTEAALATVICIYYSNLSYITQGNWQLSWKATWHVDLSKIHLFRDWFLGCRSWSPHLTNSKYTMYFWQWVVEISHLEG